MKLKIAAFVSVMIIALTSTIPVWAARPQQRLKDNASTSASAAVTDDFIARLASDP